MSNTLPRLQSRDGLPKAVTLDLYIRHLDEDDELSKKSRVFGLVATDGDIALLWFHKMIVRALPMSKLNDNAKAKLETLLPPEDLRMISDYERRYRAGEYDQVKAKVEHKARFDAGF